MSKSNISGLNSLNLETHYIQRPRLNKILDDATHGSLVCVIAGAGYGKTQAVLHYIEQRKCATTRWLQLTDSDNVTSLFWEHLIRIAFVNNPDLADELSGFGFPETLPHFKHLAEIINIKQSRQQKTFIVLDDFHLIYSKEILVFMERLVHLQLLGVCVIILSRKEPEINVVSLFSKGKINIITEGELCFTTSEAGEFFMQRVIPVSAQNLLQLMEATKGWPLAINMLSLILKRIPDNLKYALDTIMQNIFKFLEVEAWSDFSKNVQKMIVKLSLLSDLPIAPLQEFSSETDLLKSTSELSSFVWFNSLTNELRIHPLYLEFLQGKQDVLSYEEKEDIYSKAAQWCSENNLYMDAIQYYAKLNKFECMIKILFSYPFKLPRDTSEYLLNTLENLDPNHGEQSNPNVLFLKNYFIPLLLVGAGRYEEAKERALAVIQEWEGMDSPLAIVILYLTYSNLAYIDMYICTVTHEYNGPEYAKKFVEYFKQSTIPPMEVSGAFISAEIRSFACLVGEGSDLAKLDEFLEASKQTALYIAQTPLEIYTGYDDLVACEYAFFKNQPYCARIHANNAILKARGKKQYNISAMAEKYLLRTAMQEGNVSLVKEALKQMHSSLNNLDFRSRQLYYDLYTGLFYAQIGLPEMVPLWLVMDDREVASEIHMPSRELIIIAWYCIASKKYDQALVILCNSYPREAHERFLFGELRILLLTAVARIKTGDSEGAVSDLEKAYNLSFQGVFEMFFIELGKELHALIVAALSHSDCSIPKEWLGEIERKTSIYSKKVAVIASAIKNEMNIIETISLSARENEVLNDLYHGLSREEIATNRYLSVNTVKKILQSIYLKLDAQNNVDAVRIAFERKLIE